MINEDDLDESLFAFPKNFSVKRISMISRWIANLKISS